MKIDEFLLQEMVREIVREVDPTRILLFGSRSTNTHRADSDIDLLIVEETPFGPHHSRRAEATRLWKVLSRFRVAKDILVFSEEEFTRLGEVFDHVVWHALREGKRLYERL
ncbi:MAG: nucleotidyltransferase domain-containing protein [Magnetococcales bacterium]|nr:nucleotidyltransferase domain-containing protein [Magnetococcales bacterium]